MNIPSVSFLDDDQDLLQLYSDMAKALGINSIVYDSAKKFFSNIENIEKNSLLVLDLSMPGMDGIQVMRNLVGTANVPKLILVSGHDESVLHSAEKLGRAQGLDVVAALNKPIVFFDFERAVKKYAKKINEESDVARKVDDVVRPEELLRAIDGDQLILHYQPKINIETESLVGVEALVRWQHPQKGIIYPDQFISVAETHGWIGKLTHSVIEMSVEQGVHWKAAGLNVPISVNVSSDNITSLSLPEQLASMLEEKKLDPSNLMLEITESALMGELVTSLDILTRLRIKGIGLSIDDFGTGYSSLSQLHRIPFTELKIDCSFVFSMHEDAEALAIVKTCIMLGHELNMKVVAEGVETQQHWDILKGLGCDIAQGYFISRPIPSGQLYDLYSDGLNC